MIAIFSEIKKKGTKSHQLKALPLRRALSLSSFCGYAFLKNDFQIFVFQFLVSEISFSDFSISDF